MNDFVSNKIKVVSSPISLPLDSISIGKSNLLFPVLNQSILQKIAETSTNIVETDIVDIILEKDSIETLGKVETIAKEELNIKNEDIQIQKAELTLEQKQRLEKQRVQAGKEAVKNDRGWIDNNLVDTPNKNR